MLHILLVERLPREREILATAFEHRGVRVSVAGNDVEAYSAITTTGFRDVVALVTNVNLGRGTTGFDVARAARAVRPDLAVVYVTAEDRPTTPHEVPDCLTVRKPRTLSQVADLVLDYLHRRDLAGDQDRAQA